MGIPRAIINGRLVHFVVSRVARLEYVERSPHVSLGKLEEGLFAIGRDLDTVRESPSSVIDPLGSGTPDSPFPLDHLVDLLLDFLFWQGAEPELGASRLDRRRDLVDVIAKDTEPDVLGVLLDDYKDGISPDQSGAATARSRAEGDD